MTESDQKPTMTADQALDLLEQFGIGPGELPIVMRAVKVLDAAGQNGNPPPGPRTNVIYAGTSPTSGSSTPRLPNPDDQPQTPEMALQGVFGTDRPGRYRDR